MFHGGAGLASICGPGWHLTLAWQTLQSEEAQQDSPKSAKGQDQSSAACPMWILSNSTRLKRWCKACQLGEEIGGQSADLGAPKECRSPGKERSSTGPLGVLPGFHHRVGGRNKANLASASPRKGYRPAMIPASGTPQFQCQAFVNSYRHTVTSTTLGAVQLSLSKAKKGPYGRVIECRRGGETNPLQSVEQEQKSKGKGSQCLLRHPMPCQFGRSSGPRRSQQGDSEARRQPVSPSQAP